MPEILIEAPLGGLSDDRAFVEQPPSTTRDARNVRAIDKLTGRTRLSTRSGLSLYNDTQLNATGKTAWLEQITYNNLKVDYDLNDPATEVWSKVTPDKGGAYSMQVSARGDVYVLSKPSSGSAFWRYNSDGVLLSTTTINSTDLGECWTFFVDGEDDVWIAVSSGGTLTSGRRLLFRYQLQDDGTHRLIYTMRYGAGSNNVEFIKAVYVKAGILYTLQSDNDVATPTFYMRSYRNIREFFEPEDVDLDLDLNGDLSTTMDSGDLVVNKAGEIIVTGYDQIGTFDSWLCKYSPSGALHSGWTKRGTVHGGGIGGAVALDSEDDVYTMGVGLSGDNNYLRKWTDAGTTLAVAWIVDDTNNTDPAFYQKIRVDEWDNLIVPFTRSISGSWTEWRIYDAAGALVLGVNVTGAINNVAIPPKNPTYDPASNPEVPEFVYACGQGVPLKKFRTASAVAKAGSTRTTKLLSIGDDGAVKLFDSATVGASLGTLAITGDWYMTAVQFGKVYIADGETYYEVDPVAETMTELLSNTSGSIPRRCILIASWRGRLVLAGDPDDRHNWHMSAAGDAQDWDTSPSIITSSTAVSGNSAEQIGRVPDIVNAIIPYSDDVLLWGCDHSIYMMRGDPMTGGTLDLVNDQIGMAFGKPWTRGPDGRIYFFGSRGGIYALHPYTGAVERMTSDNIERRMLDVDLSTYFVRLAWNWRDEGLHVLQMPYGGGGEVTTHWFWDSKNGGWWEDAFGVEDDTTSQPTAVIVSDGDDPDDRVLIFGTEDGYVAKWDKDATADIEVPIDAYCLYGPFQGPELTRELMVLDFTAVLSDSQGGCSYEFYVNDRPDVLPTAPSADGVLVPGRNPRRSVRARGTSVWMRLRTCESASGWAVEHVNANYRLAGRMRVQS